MNILQSNRLAKVEQKVRELYEAKRPDRADWADWLYEHHVFVVADKSQELAKRYGVNAELAVAAAMLHDIADAVMSRFDDKHNDRSVQIAQELLQQSDYSDEEIYIIIDDIIAKHGCRGGIVPESLEGKVMATADALAHIETDFYHHALWALGHEGKTYDGAKRYVHNKLERDYQEKILFDDVRRDVKPTYEAIKSMIQI